MSVQGQDRGRFFTRVRQVAARTFGRAAGRPEPARRSPASDSAGRDRDGAPELWKEPVPVMKDREGHLHLLL
jgi:hypothetical protein